MKMQKFYNLLFLSVGYEEHKNVSFSPNEYLGCAVKETLSLCVLAKALKMVVAFQQCW